ncbi:MAG TPA: hypothetical protein VFP11_13800, partial [Candidatus Angelobacter sp.]|nr:hypothetical protein [Candidatus Angelobacter sp.]
NGRNSRQIKADLSGGLFGCLRDFLCKYHLELRLSLSAARAVLLSRKNFRKLMDQRVLRPIFFLWG